MQVDFTGTIRAFEPDVRAGLHEGLEQAFALARHMGGDYELNHPYGYPPTVNDAGAARFIRGVAENLIGKSRVDNAKPMMAGEDFAYMAQKAKGGFINLGAAVGDKPRPHHHPDFDINEDVMYIGSAVLAETVRRFLQR